MRFPRKKLATSLLSVFLFDTCQLKPTFVFSYSKLLKTIIFVLFFLECKTIDLTENITIKHVWSTFLMTQLYPSWGEKNSYKKDLGHYQEKWFFKALLIAKKTITVKREIFNYS